MQVCVYEGLRMEDWPVNEVERVRGRNESVESWECGWRCGLFVQNHCGKYPSSAFSLQTVFDEKTPDLSLTLFKLSFQDFTGGVGVDVVLEMLSNVNLKNDLQLVAKHGRIIVSAVCACVWCVCVCVCVWYVRLVCVRGRVGEWCGLCARGQCGVSVSECGAWCACMHVSEGERDARTHAHLCSW